MTIAYQKLMRMGRKRNKQVYQKMYTVKQMMELIKDVEILKQEVDNLKKNENSHVKYIIKKHTKR